MKQPLGLSALCIDLGTSWGWALLVDGRVTESGEEKLPPSSEPLGVRWIYFDRWLLEQITRARPSAVIFEVPFGRYVNVLKIQFGQATIVEILCERLGLEYMGVKPQDIKEFATGKRRASKGI